MNNIIPIIDKWLNFEDIKEQVGYADIMLFPYREASQSGSIMLALQYEIPQIISNVDALAEQTDSSCALIINDITPEKLAAAITDLSVNHDKLNHLKLKNKQVKERYDWETIASDFESFVREYI